MVVVVAVLLLLPISQGKWTMGKKKKLWLALKVVSKDPRLGLQCVHH